MSATLTMQRDRERPVYNLKEAMLAKCYIEVLGLDKHSAAAQKLIKWKQPVDGQVSQLTDQYFLLIVSLKGSPVILLECATMKLPPARQWKKGRCP